MLVGCIASILGYLIGSIPFAIGIQRLYGFDLKTTGSGNLGTTNMYRQGGWKPAALLLTLDASKTAIPTSLAIVYFSNPWWHVSVGLLAIVGHIWSVFLRFNGGKGVAPGLGFLLVLSPLIWASLALVASLVIRTTRYVSVASLLGAGIAPLMAYFLHLPVAYISAITGLSALVIFKHQSNIRRLLDGTEHKV